MQPYTLVGHERPVSCLKFNRDNDLLFSAGKDGIVAVYNVESGKRLGTYQAADTDVSTVMKAVDAIDVDFESKLLATGDASK